MNANKRLTDISWRGTKPTPKTPSERARRFGEGRGLSRSSTRRTTARTHAGGDTGFVLTRSFAGLLATFRELPRGVSGALRRFYESMRLLARFHQMLPRVAHYPWRRDHRQV